MKNAKKNIFNMKYALEFIRDSFKNFSASANGEYDKHTNDLNEIRAEMFGKTGSVREDKENLMKDKKAVAYDIRKAFNNLVID